MKKIAHVVALSFFLLLALRPSFTQGNRLWENVITQLLEYPAPPPPMLKVVADAMAAQEQRAKRYFDNPSAEPGADAVASEIIGYWDQQIQRETGKQPTEQARWELLEACLTEHDFDFRVLELLPDTPEAHERIKQFLAQPEPQHLNPSESHYYKQAQENLRYWLMQHSNYARKELMQYASEVKLEQGDLVGASSLTALTRLDWQSAQPLLENYRKHPESAISTLALKLLYLHAVEAQDNRQAEELRQQLQRIVINPQANDDAREMAYKTVMQHNWAGREDWFTALFAREQLLAKESPLLRLPALAAPIMQDLEKWVPILRQLVASPAPLVHNNAALCLARIVSQKNNRDAAFALLPWLTNPGWVKTENEYDRPFMITAMGKIQLPEAIAGLLFILQNEKGEVRRTAIRALSNYRDPQIIARILPMVESFVRRQPKDENQSELIQLLMGLGGLDEKEKTTALERFAAAAEVNANDWGGEQKLYLREPKSLDETIGDLLVEKQRYGKKIDTATLATSVVERWRRLRKENPPLAAKLWVIVSNWDYPVIEVAMAEQIADGSADLNILLIALEHRQRLTANTRIILQPMLQQSGFAVGIATVLLNDEAKANEILQGQDREAQLGLLACARLVRQALPIAMVGQLFKQKENLLVLAAERYLESEDSAAARQLILARHKGEALILGAYDNFTPKPKYWDEWTNWENALREEVRRGQTEEVFGEFERHWSDGGVENPYRNVEIRIRDEQATVCQSKDKARKECRALLMEELSALRVLFDEVNFDELTPMPVPGNGFGGMSQEFIWLDKNGGRRVFAANLFELRGGRRGYGLKERTPHERLEAFFDKLKETGTYELRYALKDKIKDLEVISANDNLPVLHVCGQEDEMRALVKDEKGKFSDPPKWLRVTDGKLGAETNQPAVCQIVDNREDMPESERHSVGYEPPLWQIKTRDGVVREMTWHDEAGVYLCQVGRDPKLLIKGYAIRRLVTLDGRWLLLVKRTDGVDSLHQIDLKTGATKELKIETMGWPITIEPLSGRVVFSHWGTEKVYLYTPATNKLEPLSGDTEPLTHQEQRPLQRIASSKFEFWAAIPDYESKKTKIGRYDARNFKFRSLLELSDIQFTSMQMWVDEAKRQLYIAYNGHLLRLPFQL